MPEGKALPTALGVDEVASAVIMLIEERRRRQEPASNAILVTIRHACKYLSLSDKSVRRMICAGELETVKIRNRRLVRMSSLERIAGTREAV